jgi:transposase
MGIGKSFLDDIDKVVLWNGEALPLMIKEEMIREYRRYELVQQQLQAMEQETKKVLEKESESSEKVMSLQKLKGIGPVSSWILVYEFFGWRQFKNVKEVGAAAGLAPTPYDSGGSKIEQGISKSGNRRVRAIMIEVGWYWLMHQPRSKLSKWFMERYGHGSKRMRRIGIVALARKLLTALWKYLEQGIIPEGAVLKAKS